MTVVFGRREENGDDDENVVEEDCDSVLAKVPVTLKTVPTV
jgi:hypothetical protein